MTPPEQALNFMASGSNRPRRAGKIASANWFGNEAMWVVLPDRARSLVALRQIPPYG